MKIKNIEVGRYIYEGKNLDDASEEFLEKSAILIGYIIQSFNTLEETLDGFICSLINDFADTIGLIIIYKMNYSAKVNLFKRLSLNFQTIYNKKIPCFDELITKLLYAGTIRNQVVHADWETSDELGFTHNKYKIKKEGMYHEYIQFTEKTLENINDIIDDTYIMLGSDYFEMVGKIEKHGPYE